MMQDKLPVFVICCCQLEVVLPVEGLPLLRNPVDCAEPSKAPCRHRSSTCYRRYAMKMFGASRTGYDTDRVVREVPFHNSRDDSTVPRSSRASAVL